ncbi:MAG TPA: hypothetical protein VGO79_01820 [Thermoanaerobaculia bacterium]
MPRRPVAFLLATSALATASRASSPSGLLCEKAGVVVDSCCCVMQDGKVICTLTGEPVDSCFCSAS